MIPVGYITSVRIFDEFLVTASEDKTLRKWDIENDGEFILEYVGHRNVVNDFILTGTSENKYFSANKMLCSCALDQSVKHMRCSLLLKQISLSSCARILYDCLVGCSDWPKVQSFWLAETTSFEINENWIKQGFTYNMLARSITPTMIFLRSKLQAKTTLNTEGANKTVTN